FYFGIDAARTATEPSGVLLGMEMVLKQFQDFLEAQNISAIPSDPGVDFDPNLHEAVAQEFDNKVAEGLIIKTVRSGYRMGERLIRASNVVVSKGSQTSA
ncbi:nucleotide exchange factor GrpE, partial [Verrucomicrobiales bacterium]|nr:nucleotide exchange factor GrpE [Verrucomicrobiales bacterium]